MSISKSKALAVFICFTLAATIVFSYTMYMWIGVAGSLREMKTEIQRITVNNNSDASDLNVTIMIRNPSRFPFWIAYIAIKGVRVSQFTYQLDIERDPGSFRAYYDAYTQTGTPLEVKSASNVSVHFRFQIPLAQLLLTEDTELDLGIRLHLLTLFTRENVIRMEVARSYTMPSEQV